MNIAIASETEEIDGLVPATFKERSVFDDY